VVEKQNMSIGMVGRSIMTTTTKGVVQQSTKVMPSRR